MKFLEMESQVAREYKAKPVYKTGKWTLELYFNTRSKELELVACDGFYLAWIGFGIVTGYAFASGGVPKAIINAAQNLKADLDTLNFLLGRVN